jgi:hypothetical protein
MLALACGAASAQAPSRAPSADDSAAAERSLRLLQDELRALSDRVRLAEQSIVRDRGAADIPGMDRVLDYAERLVQNQISLDAAVRSLQSQVETLAQRVGALASFGAAPGTTDDAGDYLEPRSLVGEAEEFRSLVERLRGGGRQAPFHVIDLPGEAPTVQFSIDAIRHVTDRDLLWLGRDREEVEATIGEALSRCVVFRMPPRQLSTATVLGNGVLLDASTVITARHVAEEIAFRLGRDDSDRIRATMPGRSDADGMVIESVVLLSSASDPDLALVRVRDAPEVGRLAVRAPNVPVRAQVFSIGAWSLNPMPILSKGIVTTSEARRLVRPELKLTVMGTSLSSFDGMSGAPVFSCEDGVLVGLYVAGWKWFALGGESVIPGPERTELWEGFPNWSWIVPIHSHMPLIQAHQ